jgi:hypothetical protein
LSIEVSIEDFVAEVFSCSTRINRKYLGESGFFYLNVHSWLIYDRKTVFITSGKLAYAGQLCGVNCGTLCNCIVYCSCTS